MRAKQSLVYLSFPAKLCLSYKFAMEKYWKLKQDTKVANDLNVFTDLETNSFGQIMLKVTSRQIVKFVYQGLNWHFFVQAECHSLKVKSKSNQG